ncbi:MAG: hypothetical protein ACKOSS_01190 [Planctomycetia bacterium]
MPDARPFEFPIPPGSSPEAVLARARAQAQGAGVTLTGDAHAGSFDGAASGTYRVEGQVLHVEVARKPAFVPWGLVESTLRRLFGA